VNQFSYLSNREKCISLFTGMFRDLWPRVLWLFMHEQAGRFWIELRPLSNLIWVEIACMLEVACKIHSFEYRLHFRCFVLFIYIIACS
jgi:hypothetical protein